MNKKERGRLFSYFDSENEKTRKTASKRMVVDRSTAISLLNTPIFTKTTKTAEKSNKLLISSDEEENVNALSKNSLR